MNYPPPERPENTQPLVPYPPPQPYVSYPPVPRAPKKNAIVALVLSFFLPGVGHMYVGNVGLGVALLCLWLLSLLLIIVLIGLVTAPIVWIFGMAHSAVLAERRNAEHGYS